MRLVRAGLGTHVMVAPAAGLTAVPKRTRIASDVFERSTRSEDVILLMPNFLRPLSTGQAERSVAFNRLPLHREVRPTWTTDLDDIASQSDRFRELAFAFR